MAVCGSSYPSRKVTPAATSSVAPAALSTFVSRNTVPPAAGWAFSRPVLVTEPQPPGQLVMPPFLSVSVPVFTTLPPLLLKYTVAPSMADVPVVLWFVSVKPSPIVVVAPASSIVPVEDTTTPPADPVPRRLAPVPVVVNRPDTVRVPPPVVGLGAPKVAPPVTSMFRALAAPVTAVLPEATWNSPGPPMEEPSRSSEKYCCPSVLLSCSVAPASRSIEPDW